MNAYEIKALKDMGVNIPTLGCVLLDIEPIDTAALIPPEWAYIARNPERHWIKGMNAGNHITLLFGLLANANTIRGAVDEVMAGWEPRELALISVGSFPSTFEDEPYSCIVGHVARTPALLDAHARLSMLPHIDTHPEYKPHLTLGYVHRDHEQEAIAILKRAPLPVTPLGLNYGRKP